MTKFTLSLFVIAFLLVQSTRSESVSDSIKSKQIKEITVYSTLYKNLSLPMVLVDKATLEATSFFSAADELQRETGISIARDGIWATSVNIRGLSEQRLLFMVDGDRIQTATDIAGSLSTVDMSSLDKIEVIKGASSVLYGSGAMGGIVNFVSDRPVYSPVLKTTGRIASGFNTVNNLWANSANLQFTTKQWYMSLNGSYRTAQNTQAPNREILNSQFHDASWGLVAGIKYAANEEFLVNYQHFSGWDIGLPGGSAFPKTAEVRYKSIERNLLSGEYIITDINENLQKLSLKAYTQNISRDVENYPNPLSTTYPKSLVLPGSTNSTSGAKVTSDWNFTNNHKLILGAEGWLRQSETTRLKIVTASDTLFTVFGEQPTPNAKMYDFGVFSQYSWKIIPRKLTLNAGLRFDYIRTENDTAFNPLFKYTVTKGVRKDAPNLNRIVLFESAVHPEFAYAAHLDVVYDVSQYQKISLLLANSYRAASIEERFKFIDLSGPKTKVGNPDLKPERGTSLNLSYLFLNNRIKIKTDIFANYIIDLIVEEPGVFLGNAAQINTNISKALFLGAELEANWNINKNFSLLANSSYTYTRDVDLNTALPQIPPLKGFSSFNYHSGGLLEASISTLWAASQNEIALGETTTEGYIIYNFDVHSTPIQFNKTQLQLFAGVNNMLNTLYTNHLTSNRVGQDKFPEPGRNIYVKAKFNF